MTEIERSTIVRLQYEGHGYKSIATITGLPVNNIKMFCKRNPIPPEDLCPVCGKPMIRKPGKKKKRFCSDRCRNAWWRNHPTEGNRKAFHEHICLQCGSAFLSYGKAPRKYCSRCCYYLSLRKEG